MNTLQQQKIKFNVTVSETLSRDTEVITDDYIPEYDAEDKSVGYDTTDTRWSKVYYDNGHYTPQQLISIFKVHLQEELIRMGNAVDRNYYKHLIEECSRWNIDEIEIVRN